MHAGCVRTHTDILQDHRASDTPVSGVSFLHLLASTKAIGDRQLGHHPTPPSHRRGHRTAVSARSPRGGVRRAAWLAIHGENPQDCAGDRWQRPCDRSGYREPRDPQIPSRRGGLLLARRRTHPDEHHNVTSIPSVRCSGQTVDRRLHAGIPMSGSQRSTCSTADHRAGKRRRPHATDHHP